MEVDSGIDCFSPNNLQCLGVNHHRACFLVGGLDHSFGNPILMVRVGGTWFLCCAMSSKQQLDGLVVIFTVAIITPQLFHFLSNGVNSVL